MKGRGRKREQNPHLMNSNSIHVSIIHKPNDLIREQFSIILRGEVRFSRF